LLKKWVSRFLLFDPWKVGVQVSLEFFGKWVSRFLSHSFSRVFFIVWKEVGVQVFSISPGFPGFCQDDRSE